MTSRPGIRYVLILALILFALLAGGGSALLEITTLTRTEVEAAVARAELAANLVTSQLAVSLRSNAAASPADVIRTDPRLASVLVDAQQFTPSVVYLMVADTTGLVLCHSDSLRRGTYAEERAALAPTEGAELLAQFVAITRAHEEWEIAVPILLDGRDFGAVRVGLSPELLRDRMRTILRTQIVKLFIQVLLATLLGVAVSWALFLRPLSRIEAGISHLQRGDFAHRVPVQSGDEFGALARRINELSETLSREREQLLLQRDTLVSEGDALRRLVDAVDDGLVMIDPERRVLMANRTACRILAVDFSELAGRDLGSTLGEGHPLVQMVDRALGDTRRQESTPIRFSSPDGERAYLGMCHVVGKGAERQGGMITLRDYGRMREIQEMLDHARVLSRLGKMAAGVAHEVRNPLNAMNIHLELLKQKLEPAGLPALSHHAAVVQKEIDRLERVVYGFLKLARLQEPALSRIELEPLLSGLHELVLPEARLARVEIEVDVEPGLPAVYGDEELLRQALLNLLRNAIQASPPGSPAIRLGAERRGDRIGVVVADHGKGIPRALQEKVFDLYFTTREGGTGVGLALVQQAVEMHGGEIHVESDEGAGATFTMLLPAFTLP